MHFSENFRSYFWRIRFKKIYIIFLQHFLDWRSQRKIEKVCFTERTKHIPPDYSQNFPIKISKTYKVFEISSRFSSKIFSSLREKHYKLKSSINIYPKNLLDELSFSGKSVSNFSVSKYHRNWRTAAKVLFSIFREKSSVVGKISEQFSAELLCWKS